MLIATALGLILNVTIWFLLWDSYLSPINVLGAQGHSWAYQA